MTFDQHTITDLTAVVLSGLFAGLIHTVLISRRFGKFEFKFDLMWEDYAKRYGLNGHGKKSQAQGD